MFNKLLSFRMPKRSRSRSQSQVEGRRRLSVERMESRLMLSATGLNDAEPVSFIVPYITYRGQAQYLSFATPKVSLGPDTQDGGFINADSGAMTNRFNAFSDSTSVRNYSVDSILTGNGQASGGTAAWMVDHDGLELSVIPVFANDTAFQADSMPIIGFSERQHDQLEGGPISIPTLLTSLKRESTLARNERLHSPLDDRSAALTALSTKNVSSELARATVFEIMDGVGDASGPSSRNDQRKGSSAGLQTTEVVQPLSSINAFDSLPERAEVGSSQSTKQEGASDASSRRFSRSQIRAASGGYSEYLSASNALLDRSWFTPPSNDAENLADNASTLDAGAPDNEPALAAAFEKFGRGETAMVEFKSDGELLGRLANVSPLLLILALERISALQGRRAQRQGKPELRQKSQRSTLS